MVWGISLLHLIKSDYQCVILRPISEIRLGAKGKARSMEKRSKPGVCEHFKEGANIGSSIWMNSETGCRSMMTLGLFGRATASGYHFTKGKGFKGCLKTQLTAN